MYGLLPYSKFLNFSLSGVAGHRFGCSSRLSIASLKPRYHFWARVGILGVHLPVEESEVALGAAG